MEASGFARIRALAFNACFYGWTTVLVFAALPAAPFLNGRQMRRYAGFWERGVQTLLRFWLGIRHEVSGTANLPAEPVIIAAKHQSAWETLFFHTVRPDTVIGLKQELRRLPLFGWFLAIGENIFIDRRGAARALRSLTEGAERAVGRGCSVLIFPEGTRRPPGSPPDYKPGVAALYAALGVPVVPVALNSGLFWGPGVFNKRSGVIRVVFLEPIPPGLQRKAFMAELERRIEGATRALEGRDENVGSD